MLIRDFTEALIGAGKIAVAEEKRVRECLEHAFSAPKDRFFYETFYDPVIGSFRDVRYLVMDYVWLGDMGDDLRVLERARAQMVRLIVSLRDSKEMNQGFCWIDEGEDRLLRIYLTNSPGYLILGYSSVEINKVRRELRTVQEQLQVAKKEEERDISDPRRQTIPLITDQEQTRFLDPLHPEQETATLPPAPEVVKPEAKDAPVDWDAVRRGEVEPDDSCLSSEEKLEIVLGRIVLESDHHRDESGLSSSAKLDRALVEAGLLPRVSQFVDDGTAPPVNRGMIVAVLRGEMGPKKEQEVLSLGEKYRSWHEAIKAVCHEEFERIRTSRYLSDVSS
jgi:hypothetical protein